METEAWRVDAGATKDETGSIPCRRAIAVAATWKMALLMIGSFQFLREAGRRQKGREIFFAFFNQRVLLSRIIEEGRNGARVKMLLNS